LEGKKKKHLVDEHKAIQKRSYKLETDIHEYSMPYVYIPSYHHHCVSFGASKSSYVISNAEDEEPLLPTEAGWLLANKDII
jgi:hypothetical protein